MITIFKWLNLKLQALSSSIPYFAYMMSAISDFINYQLINLRTRLEEKFKTVLLRLLNENVKDKKAVANENFSRNFSDNLAFGHRGLYLWCILAVDR